jgi:hypothetical protein
VSGEPGSWHVALTRRGIASTEGALADLHSGPLEFGADASWIG